MRRSSKVIINKIKRKKYSDSNSLKKDKRNNLVFKRKEELVKNIIENQAQKPFDSIDETDLTVEAMSKTNRFKKDIVGKFRTVKKVNGKRKNRKVKRALKRASKGKSYNKNIIRKASLKKQKLVVRAAKYIMKSATKIVMKVLSTPYGWIATAVILIFILVANVVAGIGGGMVSSVSTIFAEESTIKQYKDVIDSINSNEIKKIEEYRAKYDEVKIEVEGESGAVKYGWKEVLIIMTIKYNQELPSPNTTEVKSELTSLFAKFNKMEKKEETVTTTEEDGSTSTKKVLTLIYSNPPIEEILEELKFTKDQKQWFESLQQSDLKSMFPNIDFESSFLGPTATGDIPTLTPEELKKLLENMPSTTVTRKKLIETAATLKGKVSYFWGGKSSCTGWNPAWGRMTLVTAQGSSTTGTYKPYGLDCSGFVDWVYRTAGVGDMFQAGGTYYQYANSYSISESQLEPGDLVFNSDLSHVGLYFGRDSYGNKLFIHCTPKGGVVIDSYKGFTIYRKAFVKF